MVKDNEYYSELAEQAVFDNLAFEELYNHYFRIVYNLIYVQVRNPETADDITSETFFKVVQNLSKFDKSRASFATWINRIAQRTLIDFYRSQGRRQETDWDDDFDAPISESELPEAQFLQDENKKLLLKALEKLSDRERQIVTMKYFSDMSNVEIAEALDITASNVGIILFRAMGKLKNSLKKFL